MNELSNLQIATIKGAIEWLAYQPALRSSRQESYAWEVADLMGKALDGCEESAAILRKELPTIKHAWISAF